MKSVIKLYGVLAIIGGIALVLSLFFSVSPCILYHVIGLPCPACGLTRAFVSLVRLEFGQAFAYHPLFFLVPFVPLLAWERLSAKWLNILSFTLFGILIVVWVVRMVLMFPHTPPLNFNEESLFAWIFRR